MREIYIVNNLGCAHCGGKIEEKINKMPEVEKATLVFATKKLEVVSNSGEDLSKKLTAVANSIESGVVIEKEEKLVKNKKTISTFASHKSDFLQVVGGAILFIIGIFVTMKFSTVGIVLYLVAYLILGLEIIMNALKNIAKGQVFDENFLMSLATIAALIIGEYPEAVGVMLFYRIGELFQDIAVERSRSQIMETADMHPETVIVLVDGVEKETPAAEGKVGDIILIKPGDRIPLDGVVVEGSSRIDTSPVTGEPVPVAVSKGEAVVSGCVNKQGVIKIKVVKALEDSMVTRILEAVEKAAANKPKIDRFITRFSKVYTPVVVIIAALTAVVPSFITGNWSHYVYTAITFLVISCPCALVLSVPLSFFSGIGAASKRGILFKGGLAIESLADIKAIVMDKTGTLTTGTFAVKKIVSVSGLTEKQMLTMAAAAERYSTHPIAESIVEEATHRNLTLVKPSQVEEISGKGLKATFKEGTLLVGNKGLMEREGVLLDRYQEETGTTVLLALEERLLGWIVIGDTIKEDAKEAVDKLKAMHLYTGILTGDSKSAAEDVGKIVGVNQVFAKLLPEEKLGKLEETRNKKGTVMFVGDGINDAPVLAGADVGAAMGSGADAAIEAADVVFMNNRVGAIPTAINIARRTKNIAKQNVIIALVVKALVMILGFLGMANMWFAVFADTGVTMICVMNSIRILYKKY